jgi:SAM-dependent methyltransferase
MTDRHAHAHVPGDADAELAELLDLDGEVLREYWAEALATVRRAAIGRQTRVVDLGAGSGVGTIGLAQRCDRAEVVAVDVDEAMLQRIREKALDLGLAPRVRTLQADLDAGWPALGPIDLTWASMSLHHLADPERVLRDVFAATRPGGVLAVAEMTGQLRFLPDDVGTGLETRCLEALAQRHADSLPHLGADWAPRLEAAGFALLDERTFTIEQDVPNERAAARYARLWLSRLRAGLADGLAVDDRRALGTLLDGDGPGSLRHVGHLQLRGSRTLTLARRVA